MLTIEDAVKDLADAIVAEVISEVRAALSDPSLRADLVRSLTAKAPVTVPKGPLPIPIEPRTIAMNFSSLRQQSNAAGSTNPR